MTLALYPRIRAAANFNNWVARCGPTLRPQHSNKKDYFSAFSPTA